MDRELFLLIRQVADLPTGSETPGVAADFELDDIIHASRCYVSKHRREFEQTEPPVFGPGRWA